MTGGTMIGGTTTGTTTGVMGITGVTTGTMGTIGITGTVQQGEIGTICANAEFGIAKPAANESAMPSERVASTANTPVMTGRCFAYATCALMLSIPVISIRLIRFNK